MSALPFIFSTLFFIESSTQFNSIKVTGSYPTILPRGDYGMAVAYDSANDTILLYGGLYNRNQFVTFKNNIFTDYGTNYPEINVCGEFYAYSQAYTQIDNELWLICQYQKLVILNTNTWNFDNPSISIPIKASGDSCLASIYNGYNTYLFVIGGGSINPGGSGSNQVQIFNLSSSEWLFQDDIPTMNVIRKNFACIVYNNRLYAIGGKLPASEYTNTVESLYIADDLYNIKTESWIYATNTLSAPMENARAVSYYNDIIVLPGWSYNEGYTTNINIIDTLTNTISVGGTIIDGFSGTAAIMDPNTQILYMFGSWNTNAPIYGVVDTYQLIPLPTTSPTSSPTSTPTMPSLSPSTAPSNAPIINPTISPSYSSVAPTFSPSLTPSESPTTNPTISPSQLPTNTPSKNPSISPISPSQPPTKKPTVIPSQSPSPTPSDTSDNNVSKGKTETYYCTLSLITFLFFVVF